jgi:hypothetical protein
MEMLQRKFYRFVVRKCARSETEFCDDLVFSLMSVDRGQWDC